MLIQEIHTGKTLENMRKAILTLDDDTIKPGALAGLTQFLRAHGIAATPGYDKGHVLRIRNFTSDEQLRQLLTQDFPKWAKEHEPGIDTTKLLDKNAVFVPLDRGERTPFAWGRFIHQYSTPLVGGLSTISAGAMLGAEALSLRSAQNGNIKKVKAGISGVAATFFVGASLALTGLGLLAARKPSVTELLQSVEPEINNDTTQIDKRIKRNTFQRYLDYGLNNPWKIATLLNVGGVIIKSVGHGIPHVQTDRHLLTGNVVKRYGIDRLEMVSTVSSLGSLGLIGMAEPEQSPDILGIKSFEKSTQARDPLEQRYRTISRKILTPLDPDNDQGKAGHLNMKAAGYLSMASNVGFAAKGVADVVVGYRHNDAIAMRARNSWPLLLLLPFNLAADYLTTLSKPRYSYSLDELATEAADLIARKLDMKTASAETVTYQAYTMSELLASHPRVTKSAHQLREAIAARLELDYGYKMPTQGNGLKEYQHLMEVSPFSKLKPPEAKPEAPAAEAKPAPEPKRDSFAERLQREAAPAARAV